MIIAITGNTSGIGKAIAERYQAAGHTIIGFSRRNNYDLSQVGTIDKIVQAAMDADIFINNAYFRIAQVDVLYAMHHIWKDKPKTIVTISSNAGDGIKSSAQPYSAFKTAIDKAVEQVQHIPGQCRVMNVRPGYVNTPRVAHVSAKKMTPEFVAEVVEWMINQTNGLIKNITLVP